MSADPLRLLQTGALSPGITGIIMRDVKSTDAGMFVHADGEMYGPMPWGPERGDTLPSAGDIAVIMFVDDGAGGSDVWCMNWWPYLTPFDSGSGASGGGSPTTSSNNVRTKIVKWSKWGITNTSKIDYPAGDDPALATQGLFSKPAGSLPLTIDCAQFNGICWLWSGAVLLGHQNSTTDYGVDTETILAQGQLIDRSQLDLGDIVVWGPGTGHHSAVVIEMADDPILASHGSSAGPIRISLSAESTAQGSYASTIRYVTHSSLDA